MTDIMRHHSHAAAPQGSRPIPTVWAAALALFSVAGLAGPAFALEPPKVVVTYGMTEPSGGLLSQEILDTPFGLGDKRVIMWEGQGGPADEGFGYFVIDVVGEFDVEYTADPDTREIVDGPIELVRYETRHHFQVHSLGGATTTETDNTTVIDETTGTGIGTLSGSTITWSVLPIRVASGMTTCEPSGAICSLAAPPGGWPRIEDETPKPFDLPPVTVGNTPQRGATFVTDNGTSYDPFDLVAWPLGNDNVRDDVLTNADSQATTYVTWFGEETDRTFVPEPAGGLMALTSLLALAGLRRRARG